MMMGGSNGFRVVTCLRVDHWFKVDHLARSHWSFVNLILFLKMSMLRPFWRSYSHGSSHLWILILLLCTSWVDGWLWPVPDPREISVSEFDYVTGMRIRDTSKTEKIIDIKTGNMTFQLRLKVNDKILHPDVKILVNGRERPVHHRERYHGMAMHGHVRLARANLGEYRKRFLLLNELDTIFLPATDDNDMEVGWARIQMMDDETIHGVFSVHSEIYTIRAIDDYKTLRERHDVDVPDPSERSHPDHKNAHMMLYRESKRVDDSLIDQAQHIFKRDDSKPVSRCGVPDEEDDFYKMFPEATQKLVKRDNGCPKTKKLLNLGIAADCTYVQHYKGEEKAIKQLIDDINRASQIFESTFNVALGIRQFEILTTCETSNERWFNKACSSDYPILDRLFDFSRWRGFRKNDGIGLWHLLTKCSSGPTVGISWMNKLCETSAQSTEKDGKTEWRSGTGVSSISVNEYMVVAHEIGHNFGSMHDCSEKLCSSKDGNCCKCDGCDCKNQWIMNPTSNIKNARFSSCTANVVCSKLPSLGKCLEDYDQTMNATGSGRCGNGIKEAGEQCDCGDPNSDACKKNPCCDGTTCKLRNGAKCDDLHDPCCDKCQFRASDFVCRPKKDMCDSEEKCTGTSGDCPDDKFTENGTPCSEVKDGKCTMGQCTTRDSQCEQAGKSFGYTQACPLFVDSCNLMCTSPLDGNCAQLSGFFSDGTPCGDKGMCQGGVCVGNQAKDLKSPSLMVGIAISALILFGIVGVLVYFVRKNRLYTSGRLDDFICHEEEVELQKQVSLRMSIMKPTPTLPFETSSPVPLLSSMTPQMTPNGTVMPTSPITNLPRVIDQLPPSEHQQSAAENNNNDANNTMTQVSAQTRFQSLVRSVSAASTNSSSVISDAETILPEGWTLDDMALILPDNEVVSPIDFAPTNNQTTDDDVGEVDMSTPHLGPTA